MPKVATRTKLQLKWLFQCNLWFHIKQQSPRRPCDILVANVGPEILKTAKLPKLQNVPKLPKNVQSSKSPKITKTALSGLANKVPAKECVGMFSECQSVYSGPDRPRSLVQSSPAFCSWFQPGQGPGALPSCPEVQGECPASRKLPREVTRPRSPSQCPGMCPEAAHGQDLLQPLGTVPRTESHIFSNTEKTLSWAFYFIYLTFKKLKSCFSCFYPYVIGSQPYWISTSCQPCLFTNCISCQPYWFYNFF